MKKLSLKLLITAAFLVSTTGMAWAEAIICAACGGEIGPGRYVQDQWKANYHAQHAKVTRCFYCARGISQHNTGGGVRYADGRHVCNLCHGTAVVDDPTAVAVASRIRARMVDWGLTFDYGEIPVRLVDQATLDRQFGRGTRHQGKISGLTTKRWTKDRAGKILSREVEIQMLYGMPMEVYEKTIAHELMHAWMFVDKQPEHRPQLEEGVCNLAAYYILQESDSAFAGFLKEAMYQSKDPTYGQGLRRAIGYVQRHEFEGLVKMLRASQDFPPGY